MTPRERIDPMQLLKLILAIAVCAALVAAAMYTTPHETSALGSPPMPTSHPQPPMWHGLPNFDNHPQDAAVELEGLMRKTKGNFSLLTPDEQSWADAYTRGNAKRMFEQKAAELQKKSTVRH